VLGWSPNLQVSGDRTMDKNKVLDHIHRGDFVIAWAGAIVVVLFATLLIEALR
jgi:hypothetical protein